MNIKVGDLVRVIRSTSDLKGAICTVNNIKKVENDEDMVFVVRIQDDLDKGLIPMCASVNLSSLMKVYTDEELRYAAHARCECGAGFAYPKNTRDTKLIDMAWECSDILTGRAPLNKEIIHSASLPFNFYEVKSEDQPSANGATTRKRE